MRQNQVKNLRAAQARFFCQCVVHTLQIYTTYTCSIFILCINFTKGLDENIFLKKKRQNFFFKEKLFFYIFWRHTWRGAFEFDQWFSGGWERFLMCRTKALIALSCMVGTAALPALWQEGKCQQSMKQDGPKIQNLHVIGFTQHTIIDLTQVNCESRLENKQFQK